MMAKSVYSWKSVTRRDRTPSQALALPCETILQLAVSLEIQIFLVKKKKKINKCNVRLLHWKMVGTQQMHINKKSPKNCAGNYTLQNGVVLILCFKCCCPLKSQGAPETGERK